MRILKVLASFVLLALASPLAAAPEVKTETVTGFFREYALGPVGSGPAIVAVDEEDTVWVALARSGQLARFINGSLELFDIGADSRPVGLAAGSAANGHPGAIWIAASYDNKLVRFDVATRQKKEFRIEGEESWPFNVALAPDGSVWFSQRASGRVGRLDPATGQVRHFDLPTPNGGPAGLAVDPRTGTVWFTESYADRVARLDPATGRVEEIVMGEASSGQGTGPAGLAIDPQGGVWFAKLEGKLGHIPPGASAIELIDVPPEALRTAGLAVAGNGDVWANALDGNLLLRYRPSTRSFTQFPVPTGRPDPKPANPPLARTSRPFGIGIDSQGNVWFSEQYAGQLGVLDVAAPTLQIFSPAGAAQMAGVPVTVRALDRVAGIETLSYELDGRPVKLDQGRLDLASLLPGPHHLKVTAVDAAANATTAEASFDYAPGPLALAEIIGRLAPADEQGTAAKERWLAAIKELPKGDAPAILAGIGESLEADLAHFRQPPGKVLQAVLQFQRERGGRSLEVAILDAAPYFAPETIKVRQGDTVLWRYNPPSDGHTLSSKLHRIEIQAGDKPVRSGLLRAGESFGYRFEAPGRYAVQDTEMPEAKVTVEVEGR